MSNTGRLAGDRAFTNPFSNNMVLSKSNMGEAFNTYAKLQLPITCAPQFMHEVTHYWCFNSPVGLAISLRYLKIKRRAFYNLVGIDISLENIKAIYDGLCLVESILEIVRPITEGVALFAENDVVVGNSEIISLPSWLLGASFSDIQVESSQYINNINPILFEARLREKQIRYKSNLLLQTINCEKGGYLPGYLLIKNFQSILIREYPKFIDSDFFFHFIKCHFFDDWDFVNIILDEDNSIWDIMNQVSTYLQLRIRRLVAEDLTEVVKDFERNGLEAKHVVFNYSKNSVDATFYSFPTSKSQYQDEGKDKMAEILDYIFSSSSNNLISKVIQTDKILFLLRAAFTIGNSSFRVVVNEHRRLLIYSDDFMPGSNFPVASFPAYDSIPSGFDKIVKIILITLVNPPDNYFLIKDGDEIIYSFSYKGKPVPENMITGLIDWETRESIERDSRELIEQILDESIMDYGEEFSAWIESVKKISEEIYNPLALIFTPDEKINKLNELMKEDGVLGVFDNDLQFIMDISAISLSTPFHVSPDKAFIDRKWSFGSYINVRNKANELLFKYGGFNAFVGGDNFTLNQI